MHTRWVSVSVQEAPSEAVTQVMEGVPGQLVTTVPRVAVGVRMTGWLMSTHCVPALPVQLAVEHASVEDSFLLQYSLITDSDSLAFRICPGWREALRTHAILCRGRMFGVLAVFEGMWYPHHMMDYELVRSRRRTASLEVTKECKVLVRAPLRMPRREIDAFVASHRTWVEKQLAKRRAQPVLPEPTAEEVAALKERARLLIEPRVARYAARMGLRPAGVRITAARTRYGSCSAVNRLCFSCFLAECPEEAVDLVVVHELCHIVHKNHGPQFYALLESVLPDWRERKRLLTMR